MRPNIEYMTLRTGSQSSGHTLWRRGWTAAGPHRQAHAGEVLRGEVDDVERELCGHTHTHTNHNHIPYLLYYYPTAATGIVIAIGRTRIEVVTVIIVLIE